MDVLLVEDQPLIRETIAEGLRAAGFEVGEQSSAEEARNLADAQPRWPRVVVADLYLRGHLNGLALGAEMRRRAPVSASSMPPATPTIWMVMCSAHVSVTS